MKLYGFPGSPNTWKVRAVRGPPRRSRCGGGCLSTSARARQRAPDYLGSTRDRADADARRRRLRPYGSRRAIMQYLASRKPERALARGRAGPGRHHALAELAPAALVVGEPARRCCFERFVKGFFNMGPPDAAVVGRATEAFHREAAVLDRHLETAALSSASGPTLADFTVVAPLVYAAEGELPLGDYRHIRDWSARLLAFPAWRDTSPARPAEAA